MSDNVLKFTPRPKRKLTEEEWASANAIGERIHGAQFCLDRMMKLSEREDVLMTSIVCVATVDVKDPHTGKFVKSDLIIDHANACEEPHMLLAGMSRCEHGINVMLEKRRVAQAAQDAQAPCDTEPKGE